MRRLNACLDLESIVQRLSDTNSAVLMLRAAGFEWNEIAEIFGTSVAASQLFLARDRQNQKVKLPVLQVSFVFSVRLQFP